MTEDLSVTRLREYLRIKTEHPNIDYRACRDFLMKYANELQIPSYFYETAPNVFVIVMTIKGYDSNLKSIMLYSHTDVVPTVPEKWKYDPYSAHKDENGDIFARGTQDMKSLGIIYMEALRKWFNKGIRQFKRTIHIVWAPDEEVGSKTGMDVFTKTEEFKKMNIVFALDESMSWPENVYKVFYGDRTTWWIKVSVTGVAGHGALISENTAAEKLARLISVINKARNERADILKNDPNVRIGDLTSFNITSVHGGTHPNVIPNHFEAIIDMRVSPKDNYENVKKMIENWLVEAGEGITYEFLQYNEGKEITPTTREDPFWAAFEDSLSSHNCKFIKEICPGHTDSRFMRSQGIRSIGFSPFANTKMRIHDHNEYINEKVFLEGISIYETLINNLANV